MQIPEPIPLQSESELHPAQLFDLQTGVAAVEGGTLQSLFMRQPTHVPFVTVAVVAVAQTGLLAFFVAQAVVPAASHPSQVPVSRLQMGVWGVVHWVSMRQPTHIPFTKVAVAVVTQTGLFASFVAHALESAHAWHVPVDVLQIGAWGVLQSLFVRQPTHIPANEPASPGTQTGVPASGPPQAAVFSALQPRQLPASTSQMGVFPVQLEQVNGAPPVPLAPAAPPSPPAPPRPPVPPPTQRFIVVSQWGDPAWWQSLS